MLLFYLLIARPPRTTVSPTLLADTTPFRSWHVGDPYGVEIARFDLPRGYIFGTSAPGGNKLVAASVKEVSFDPEQLTPSMSASVPISAMRSNTGGGVVPKLVDTITASMLKDTNN